MTLSSHPRHRRRPFPPKLVELNPIPVDRSIVESAERLLREDKAGRIRSLVIVGSMNGSRDVFRVVHRNGDPFVIGGALAWALKCSQEDIE